MSFARYPSYKPSGVEWVSDIPVHWHVSRLKWHLTRNDGGVWGDDPDGLNDTIVLRSTEQTIDGHWHIEEPAKRRLGPADFTNALLETGDLLVTKSSGSSLHIGKTTVVTEEVADLRCCFSNFMQRLRLAPSLSPRLAWYLLNSDVARRQFDLLSNSTTGLANLSGGLIDDLEVVIPPPDEQPALVAFLDGETAKLDALVAEQERLIERLDEKRQALISHAVTKGLNPDAPMKPSGIDWLGDVPAHWELSPLKRDLEFVTSGSRGWAENYSEHGELFLRVANLTRDSVALDLTDVQRVSVPAGAESARTMVRPGDVLFSITAYLGSVAVIPQLAETAYVSQHVALARFGGPRLLPRWVGYVALSLVGRTWFDMQSYGGTKIQLSLDDVRNLPVPVPPVEEQHAVLVRLDAELARLRALSAEVEHATELFQERRVTLISAAVTGQIDVRGVAPQAA